MRFIIFVSGDGLRIFIRWLMMGFRGGCGMRVEDFILIIFYEDMLRCCILIY